MKKSIPGVDGSFAEGVDALWVTEAGRHTLAARRDIRDRQHHNAQLFFCTNQRRHSDAALTVLPCFSFSFFTIYKYTMYATDKNMHFCLISWSRFYAQNYERSSKDDEKLKTRHNYE
jgi:hypothetical protein